MKRKIFLVLILFMVLTGTIFSQHKYESFDVLLGFGMGLGVTPTAYEMISTPWPAAKYAAAADFGLNLDVYLLPWLSVSTGAFARAGAYVNMLVPFDPSGNDTAMLDFLTTARTPVSVSIPYSLHINVPYLNFLYLGAGGAINIPVYHISLSNIGGTNISIPGSRGDIFFSAFVEVGFDLVGQDKGGGRFVIKAAPEFHKDGMYLPVGFMWQFHNFRLNN